MHAEAACPVADEGCALSLDLAPRIAPALAARLEGLGAQAPADLSFANLWLFRRPHRYRFHEGDWPCISGLAYDGQPHAIALFDLTRAPLSVLRQLIRRHGSLFPVTARELRCFDPAQWQLQARRDDADYVYPAAQFRDYGGRALHKKRNLEAQLLKSHRVSTQAYEPALAAEAVAVLDGWLLDKGKSPGEADDPACREALAHAPGLGLHGFLYRADGQAAGFLLAEQLQPGLWVVRFAKGLARFKGIAQHMFRHFAQHAPQPAQWLNFEQDLGLANFRRTKLSYQPAALLPKWRVGLNDGA